MVCIHLAALLCFPMWHVPVLSAFHGSVPSTVTHKVKGSVWHEGCLETKLSHAVQAEGHLTVQAMLQADGS